MKEQDDQGADFRVYVGNMGNIRVRGEGFLLIEDRKGTELASIPLQMGSILPRDTSYLNVHHPVNLDDGNFVLSATLQYGATRGNEVGEAASIEGVDLEVKDGQPEIGCAAESKPPEPGLAPPITALTPAEEEGGSSIGQYVAYAALFLALVLAIVVFARRLRKRRPSSP
jgi:hypothetical protein